MEYRQLGRAGVRVSAIDLGTNRFGSDKLPEEKVNHIIDAALGAVRKTWSRAEHRCRLAQHRSTVFSPFTPEA